jgi:fibronectin-binding autotransporter adhesin
VFVNLNLKLAPVEFRTVQGNEMKNTKFAFSIAASIVMLIGMQSFIECRGDDSGTFTGGTFIVDPNSPTCLPLGDSYSGTTTLNAGAIINSNVSASESGTTRSSMSLTGTGTLTNNAYQLSPYCGATLDESGCSCLVKSSTGNLVLNGNNAYNGVTALSGGTLQMGSSTALGQASSGNCYLGATTICSGVTLDINNMALQTESIVVQGTGVGGNGAIVNNSAILPADLQYNSSNLTLTGNLTFSGTTNVNFLGNQYVGRWSLRPQTETVTLSASGNASSLTRVSNNQIMLVGTPLDSATSSVSVNQGVLSLEGTTSINSGTLQLNSSILNASSGTVNIGNAVLYGSLTPNVTFASGAGALIYDGSGDIQAGTLQLSNSTVTLSGATLVTGTGLLNKTGAGTLVLSGSDTYAGTVVSIGSLASNITGLGTTTLINRSNTLTGNTLTVGNLTLGSGSVLTITALPDSPAPGSALQTPGDTTEPVPEPSAMVLLSIAVLAFIRFGLVPKKSTVRP